jgi:nucleotide-binding universal stress UspA family protein
MQLQKILVPIDFSTHADRALERAIELAKLERGEIHLLHAYELPMTIGPAGAMLALSQEVLDRIRDGAREALEERASRVSAEGVKVQAHVMCDAPVSAILTAAEKIGADLIVMGTHGRTGMKHVLLGSVAERTVRLASCPVLTVKAR